jgi:hypothetical protein
VKVLAQNKAPSKALHTGAEVNMRQVAELLSPPTNSAVVQLPGRKFPGVVVQGDTLNALIMQLTRMRELLAANHLSELSEELEDLRDHLAGRRSHYEIVCASHGIGLPYTRSADNPA